MYDYIVIGAGSAGCVVAARLCEAGRRVALVEAGARARNDDVRIPAFWISLMDSEIDWGYRTTPQPGLNNRRMFLSRGRGLGGTSLMNAMVYMRGNRGDYDQWHALGNEGWSYAEVLPLFKRSERNASFGEPYHGRSGTLSVCHHPASPLMDLFLESCGTLQLPLNDDVNGERQEGCGRFQMTVDAQGRCSTDRAFLGPVLDRMNLTILADAHVTRIVVENGRAVGIRYFGGDGPGELRADGEIILCGGAINSPQLLMLSGIGPADHLLAVGIPPLHDLPGVGANLQDHLFAACRCEISEPLTLYGMSEAAMVAARAKFLEDGSGPLATNGVEAGAFLRIDPRSDFPDVQVHFSSDFGPDLMDGAPTDRHGFDLSPNVCRPRSRGSVRLRSGNPLDRPAIDPAYLADPNDLELTIAALERCRDIAAGDPFRRIGAAEIWPGPAVRTRDDMAGYIRRTANTVWHPAGTCRMGVDDTAVVDPALRVRGITHLRVADASIMPTLVSGNTNAPCIMIGEKAAELMLGG